MIRIDEKYVKNLNNILEKIVYIYILKNIRGIWDFTDPWFDFDDMLSVLEYLKIPNQESIKLLYMGIPANLSELSKELGKKSIDIMIESGIWNYDDGFVKTNNLIVLAYQGIKILTEINPHFNTCINRNTNVYIGMDSLRLAENIQFKRNSTVLDLCSGTGIQGLLAARSAKKVVSVEINPVTVKVTKFNVALNELNDLIDVRLGDLYTVIKASEKFDFIYANPPFIPMIDDLEYPICGTGGEDGLKVLKRIVEQLDRHLKDGGQSIIFSQCLGDAKQVFFNEFIEEYSQKFKYRVNCVIKERIPYEFQLELLTELTSKFNKNFDKISFKSKMKDIYNSMGATYLYTLLYKFSKSNGVDAGVCILNQSNQWDLDSKSEFLNTVSINEDKSSFELNLNDNRVGFIDSEAKDIIALLLEGYKVAEIADELYDKYKNDKKYLKYKKAAFICSILDTCSKLEQLGVIRQVEVI